MHRVHGSRESRHLGLGGFSRVVCAVPYCDWLEWLPRSTDSASYRVSPAISLRRGRRTLGSDTNMRPERFYAYSGDFFDFILRIG